MGRIEIRVRVIKGGVRRHLVIEGCERALCGTLTTGSPMEPERWAPRCQRCEGSLVAMEARS